MSTTQLNVTSLVLGQPYSGTVDVDGDASGYTGTAQFFDAPGTTQITEPMTMTTIDGRSWGFTFPPVETIKIAKGKVMLRVILVSETDAQKGEALIDAG